MYKIIQLIGIPDRLYHKLLLIMRLTTVILIASLVQVSASTFGQRLSLQRKGITLEQVFKEIRNQTGYDILLSTNEVKVSSTIDADFKNETIEEVMNRIVSGRGLTYSIEDKTILLKKKEPSFLDRLAERWANIDVRGRVVDEQGNPLPNASIRVKGKDGVVNTNEKGEFVIKGVADDAVLVISYVGYKQLEIPVKGAVMPLEIKLNQLTGQLEEVSVKGNTGYQEIDRKLHPGSFDVIDNKLLNRSVSKNILERIENLTPGILFDKTINAPDPLLIRGRNTIGSEVKPLIVLDDFPYDGNIENINPNDIENVTILKDAAAASIWGARAGNGVIVITTKKGKTNKPQITVSSNMSIVKKPDLFSDDRISTSDFIDLERYFFNQGSYEGLIGSQSIFALITPVIDILAKNRAGTITTNEANIQIDKLKQKDVRTDLMRYFYRTAVSQQNHLDVSGDSPSINYYLGAGWNKNKSNIIGSSGNDFNINSRNTFKLGSKASIDVGLLYTKIGSKSGDLPTSISPGGGKLLYPYADLVDNIGNALVLERDFKSSFKDTIGSGQLLDWNYRPYNEIFAQEGISKSNDLLLNVSSTYRILPSLSAVVTYQFQNQTSNSTIHKTIDNYYTRSLINSFTNINGINPYPVPKAGIMDINSSEIISHQGRAQLNYNKIFDRHIINVMLGGDIRSSQTLGNSHVIYGYEKRGSIVQPNMDFVNYYPQVFDPNSFALIPNNLGIAEELQRFISTYVNITYNFDQRYSLYGSLREDAANLFGVKTNLKGVPLWSFGGSWNLSNEQFFKFSKIKKLSLRASYGYSGNLNLSTSGATVIGLQNLNNSLKYATIMNPPNEELRWEKNGRLNIGIDFNIFNTISGSVEFYKSFNKDLISGAPIDPTLGVARNTPALMTRNIAHMRGEGLDLNLQTINVSNNTFNWTTNFNFSYVKTVLSKYLIPIATTPDSYTEGNTFVPVIGKPLYGLYSYPWAGLDPLTGDPQGYLGNDISKSYNEILTNTPISNLNYHGAVSSPYYMSFRNNISWKSFYLSFNITGQFGYYIRTALPTNYNSVYESWTASSNYSQRWQNPGDEKFTTIPSFVFPSVPYRDRFYSASSAVIDRGDYIRLNDLTLSYSFSRKDFQKLPFKQLAINSSVTNLNILVWRANKKRIDPIIGGNVHPSKIFNMGINLIF